MGRAKEGGDVSSLPAGVGFDPIPTKVQATDVVLVQWQELIEPAHLFFRIQIGDVIDNDAIMASLFIGTLKVVAFDWFRSFPNDSINF